VFCLLSKFFFRFTFDHLVYAIKVLSAILDPSLKHEQQSSARRQLRAERPSEKAVFISVRHGNNFSSDASGSDDDDHSDLDDATSPDEQIEPVVTQPLVFTTSW
jgi:hypothetical protein